LANKVDTTVDPLIDALGQVSNLGLDPEEVGRAAEHLSGAVRSTTDRISALNINTARPRRSSIRRSPSCATTRIRRCETPASSGGAQRLLRAQNIDPTTDAGLVKLRDSAASLENDLGNPDSRLRVLLTKALNGDCAPTWSSCGMG
jgi:putative membrane protein